MTLPGDYWRHRIGLVLSAETDTRRRRGLQASLDLIDRADAAVTSGEWLAWTAFFCESDPEMIACIQPRPVPDSIRRGMDHLRMIEIRPQGIC